MAVRTVKSAPERREEILLTAQEMFYGRGYEATSIEQIINRIGIAKGTFYHYFKSKEHLLSELADYQTDGVVATLELKLKDVRGDALEKLRFVVGELSQWKYERQELMATYLEVLYRDENVLLRYKMYESYDKIVPLYGEIIAEGAERGIFKVDDPKATVDILIAMMQGFAERVSPQILSLKKQPELAEALIEKYLAFEQAMERLLGLKEGTLKVIDVKRGREFLEYYISRTSKPTVGGGAK
jgi:AcrR family transcriptional regulator